MERLLIAATTDPDMRYAAGVAVPDPFILLDTGRARHALVSSLEYGRLKKSGLRVHRLEEYLKGKKPSLAKAAALFLKERKVRAVTMSTRAYAGVVDGLRKEKIKVKLTPELYPERAVKTKEELRKITQARDATVAAMQRCITLIKRSKANANGELVLNRKRLTSELLKAEARRVLLAHACTAEDLIISHGRQTADPHDTGSGVLRAGEPIILDLYPRGEHGYHFDMTRTVCKGAPGEEYARQWRAVQAAMKAAERAAKPGAKASAVHEAAAKELARNGYETTTDGGFIHSTGHGLGLAIHEAPSVSAKSDARLETGHVITIEPGLYYEFGVRLENTYVVTPTGLRDLTRYEQVMQV